MTSSFSEVQYIEFGLYDDRDHYNLSSVEINNQNLYSSGEPHPLGLYDTHLGTTDQSFKCLTCHQDRSKCTGHSGVLKINYPLINPIAIGDCRKLLRVLCLKCSMPIVDLTKYAKMSPLIRLAEISQVNTEGKKCRNPDCEAIHPKIIQDKEDNFTFSIQGSNETDTKQKLYSIDLYNIFNSITDATVLALGRSNENHPRKLILKDYIQIPPVTIRPGVKATAQWSGNSGTDINNILQNIVTKNRKIDPELIKNKKIDINLESSVTVLQQLYYELIHGASSIGNSTGGKRGITIANKQIVSLLKRLARKSGRIRTNLKGKKVSDICRDTISGNYKAKLTEIVIPIEFAKSQRVFEIVQEYNKDFIMTLFKNAPDKYPCITRIHKKNGREIKIDHLTQDKIIIEIGDTVERDLITGDICIINRQPTLEISSMGAHTIVVNKDSTQKTMQMNVNVCANYNADFDGDEMNLFAPKDYITRIECEYISFIDNFFVSTKNSAPINGQVQDGNIGSFELTRSNIKMNRYSAMTLFQISDIDIPFFTQSEYSGRELISLLLQKTPINFSGKPNYYNDNFAPFINYDPNEIFTVIENGILKQGVLDAKSIGPKINRGVYHLISQDYGNHAALDQIYNMQQVVISFLNIHGYTVCAEDLFLSKEARNEIKKLVEMILIESDIINDNLIKGNIIPPITYTRREFYEQLQMNALKIKDEEILRIILNDIRPETNSIFKMIATKSKGNVANLKHIVGAIEQVLIDGERMKERFGFARTLPYFPRFSLSSLSYGYIMNCYISGMTVPEFIFSSMNSRFDLINKALSTAETGYQYRKGCMSLESLHSDYFYRAVKHKNIVQLLYGDDGMDARFVEKVDFYTVKMSDSDIRTKLMSTLETDLALQLIEQIIEDKHFLMNKLLRMEHNQFNKLLDTNLSIPASVKRILKRIYTARINKPNNYGDLDEKINYINTFCDGLVYVYTNDIQKNKKVKMPIYLIKATRLFSIHIRIELCPKILELYTIDEITLVLQQVYKKFQLGLIEYGSQVSFMATQAIGEPSTQYMLDSHHRSVEGGTSKTGYEEMKQIYSDRPQEKEINPMMIIRVKEEYKYNEQKVQDIANQIELITFKRFLDRWDRLYESFDISIPNYGLRYPTFISDSEFIKDYLDSYPLLRIPNDLTNWCIRFEISKINLVLKNITLNLIIQKLREAYPHVFIISSKESNENIIIRMYVRGSFFTKKGDDDRVKVRNLIEQIKSTPIRGIKGIKSVKVKTILRHKIEDSKLVLDSDEYAIDTFGSNIEGVLSIADIDQNTVISNSIIDTFKIYGIEAARNKIITETIRFLQDSSPNSRHIKLYADEMTRTGRVTSIERKGLNKREFQNVLLRSSYSAPAQVFTEAALNNIKGPVYGISAPRLLGATPKVGTLYSDIIIDEEFINQNDLSLNNMLDDINFEEFEE